jgi:hypothetical protein
VHGKVTNKGGNRVVFGAGLPGAAVDVHLK